MNLYGLEGGLELLKLAFDLGASLTSGPAPCVSLGRGSSITLVLVARFSWEPALWVSPCISLSAGDRFCKGRSDSLEFVAGLAWVAADSLGFGGSSYVNVRNEVKRRNK